MTIDFIVIGAQKGGTTSLAASLAAHPSICFSDDKEPGFFLLSDPKASDLKRYHKLFNPLSGQLLGEASTQYTMLPESDGTAERIFENNPKVKLIYIMRDPVERILSHYAHRVVRKRAHKDPCHEIKNNPSYVFRSRYYYQLQPFLKIFPRDSILLLIFEDFIADPRSTLCKVAHFLNIDAEFYGSWDSIPAWNRSEKRKVVADYGISSVVSPLKKAGKHLPEGIQKFIINILGNSIESKPAFSQSLRRELYHQLGKEIDEIEALVGHRITKWKKCEES